VIFLVALAFFAGRYTSPERPVHFIGEPLDLQSDRTISNESKEAKTTDAASQTQRSLISAESLCKAPTRSGKPCQRKVRDGQYCYQHRGKFPPKNPGAVKTEGGN
jgi:hypothetical protein